MVGSGAAVAADMMDAFLVAKERNGWSLQARERDGGKGRGRGREGRGRGRGEGLL